MSMGRNFMDGNTTKRLEQGGTSILMGDFINLTIYSFFTESTNMESSEEQKRYSLFLEIYQPLCKTASSAQWNTSYRPDTGNPWIDYSHPETLVEHLASASRTACEQQPWDNRKHVSIPLNLSPERISGIMPFWERAFFHEHWKSILAPLHLVFPISL